jgi:uroporphyrinogen decarboxylase
MNENLMPFIGKIEKPENWLAVERHSIDAPFLRKQLDLLTAVLDECGGEGYSLATIHGICASALHPIEAAYGYVKGREVMCETLRSNRSIMLDVHKRVADTMSELATASIKAGADGIYYAALGGEKHFYTDEEFDLYIKPYDLQVMQAIRDAGGHVFLHICKENMNMNRYADYAPLTDVVNWGVYETGFSLAEGKDLFENCTIMGGLANRSGVLVDGTITELESAVRELIQGFGRQGFILGADCTLPTEIPSERILAAVRATF